MTTAADIIQAAFREGNIIPVGAQPSTAEQSEALSKLNRYIAGVFGEEMGENFVDWRAPAPQRTAPLASTFPQFPVGSEFGSYLPEAPGINVYPYPPTNSRIIFGRVNITVYFPNAPEDGARMALVSGSGAGDGGLTGSTIVLDGNGGFIQDPVTNAIAPTQIYVDPVPRQQWMYRADLATWIAVKTLALTDAIPFPFEMDDLWVCLLAIRIAPSYGKVVSGDTKQQAALMLKKLKARYRQSQRTVYGSTDFPDSLQAYINGRWFP